MARINIPPVTRAVLIGLLFQSLLSAAIRYRQWSENSAIVIPYLTLVPQLSIFYPWTFVTTTLVEGNVFTLAIGVVTLYHGGRYLERAWSSAELAKFLAIVAIIPNILTFLTLVVFYTLTRNEDWTLTVISGTVSIQIGFLVAFSQLVPAHTVTLFRGILSMRVPRFPLVYIGLVFLLTLTPLLTIAHFYLSIFGFFASWTYLRFYKTVFPDLETNQSARLRGDASETFAFAEFFPGPAKPAVRAVADNVFEVLVAMKVCTPFSQADVSAARGDAGYLQRGGPPGGARAEAERRRAIALKALDQRLHAAGAGSGKGAASVPPTSTTGPPVQQQPQPSTQTAMSTRPGEMLGETKFEPDHDEERA